ncbi:transcriptional regulator, XRE family [Trichormus variabilis ATCC 29413]|uniref:Transcriptional regulator, XRE family n=2 Tax=Anabaena variabilis TaxID=264691 RepID=Q3M3V5_TRIV2|nr:MULTISPECIES: helix-turn-helix transcriptional regulator [Nostocaceae]ABA24331.1 transcriptional regulator, XRE family [Trichormus variabilis ATCC 29413]MBC1213092.1 helix-turn-helix transcriptional regulator [Trichormus variabilis ARAD]MBC1254135.1 helix-turn-helix transcriptional regulator [Trichormus variabilis V5]MBC1267431.1 helix-turn-helix transcriptional regulator [Trichormus variabilis FSR]MBC1301200.1 helix-turn-helix transcriptional regulator [Trichormus variabilis N2B]
MSRQKKIIFEQPKIGQFIQEIRLVMGLTQEEFAVILGVTFPTVNRWENGHTKPSKLAIQQIEALLDKLGKDGQNILAKYHST